VVYPVHNVQNFVSHAGTRTRVYRVKADYPNHLDYMGFHSCTMAPCAHYNLPWKTPTSPLYVTTCVKIVKLAHLLHPPEWRNG
jgi:hypothetical protein